MRPVSHLRTMLVLGALLHFHRFHGSPLDYSALAAAAFASWVGVPGPGEPLLIAASILAAKGKLDLAEILLIAFAAATAGGVVGWLIGLKAGRTVVTWRGPFLGARRRALSRGEEVFQRHPAAAVLLTTSWIAGIMRVGTGPYMLWNAVGAALWTLAFGLGAFFAGPPIVDLVGDAGWVTVAGIVVLVVLPIGFEVLRRRRRSLTGPSSPS